MTDAVELKRLVKALQGATATEETVDLLVLLKKNVTATESLLRESKAGLAVGKLRTHAAKEVADLAKELVKKWKAEVDRAKGGAKSTPTPNGKSLRALSAPRRPSISAANGHTQAAAARKGSVADSQGTPPVTPITASTPNGLKNILRTTRSDGVNVNATGDKTRDKCIELIYDALASDSGAPNDLILKQATAVERTVLQDFGGDTTKEYKAKIRSLFLNLKDKNNPSLRESIVSGDLDVARFCKMTSQEMASEERKAADNRIQADNLHKSLGAEERQAETDAFQCGRCKQRKTRYRQAQTRSADEPMTTFVTCVNCNNRWKFS